MNALDQYQRLAREALDELATTVHNLSPGDIGSTDRVLRPIDQTLAALTAAAVELVIAELQSLDDEHQTYAQWVLEREEPVGYDKTVIRADHIHARIAALRQPQRKRVEEDDLHIHNAVATKAHEPAEARGNGR